MVKQKQLAKLYERFKKRLVYCDCGNVLTDSDEIKMFWNEDKCVCKKPAAN